MMLRTTRLTCTTGNHNKEYRVDLEQEGDVYTVRSCYGPIGGRLKSAPVKYTGKSGSWAEGVYNSLVEEKMGSGYRDPAIVDPQPIPSPTRRTPRAIRESQPEQVGTIDFYDDALRKINL